MSSTAFTRLSLSIGSLAIVLAASSTARAQLCKDTTECPQGFVCEFSATPTPAAGSGTKPSAGVAADPIAPPTAGYCEPAPCTKDSECGAGMLCHTESRKQCSGGTAPAIGCAPNSDCANVPAPSVPETCTRTTVSTCVYKWQLPCNTDVDCGAGFNCMPTVTGCASGGSGSATPGSTSTAPASRAMDLAAPVPPDSTCTTRTSFPGYCQPKATTCATNGDCPTAWTCGAGATSTTSPGGPVSSGGSTGADGGSANVASPPATDLPARPAAEETTKICQSPLGYGGTVGRDQSATDGKGGSTTGNPEVPTNTGGNPPGESADASPKAGCAIGGGTGGASSIALVAFGLVALGLARRRRS